MAFPKQLEVLRAFGLLCNDGLRIVTNSEVGSVVGLKADTVALGNGFFSSAGLLVRGEGGHTPAPELVNFARAHEWEHEAAFHKAAPVLRESWFAVELLTKLRFRPMGYEDCVGVLGQAASVGPESRTQLAYLIEFLISAGLIQMSDSGDLSYRNGTEEAPPAQPATPASAHTPNAAQPSVTQSSEGGRIRLNVHFDVDAAQLARWSPDRITAFMTGLAQVLAAQGHSESQTS
jgi:hypothetical protein